jgi:outer membrane protein TolC
VATAQQYPSFSLVGSIGLDALSSADLFSSASRSDSAAGSLAWTIFNAGAIRKNIEVQNALQEQALNRYESTVLGALEEVDNALTDYAQEQERRKALITSAEAADNAAKLARFQYTSGLVDFQSVLSADRTLLSAQDELAQSEGAVTSNLVRLYKALGGGWTPLAPPGAR